ncbi:universal stress protein [Isoptericola aurantiacus]|uniref:universal stress protein n=1 Tax=Isoptericola aurantiacus TaxID=3377839 RepID=UPI00383A5141
MALSFVRRKKKHGGGNAVQEHSGEELAMGTPSQGAPSDRPIVVGINGSPEASRALAFAVRQAERAGCTLWLVNAVHEIVPVGPMLPLISGESLIDVGHQLLAEAQEFVEDLSDGTVPVRLQVALGPAVDLLVAAAERARLVVLGHRSTTLLERMFTGSTTFGVVSRAVCPVVSVPHDWVQRADAHRVVAAVDGSWSSADVLEHAFAAAEEHAARLEIVHCWRLNPFYSYLVDESSVQEQWGLQARGIVDHLVDTAARAHPDVPFDLHLEYADVPDTLVRRSTGADLLVMGRHGHGALAARRITSVLGSVTRAVLQHARCPVEVVASRPAMEATREHEATERAQVTATGDPQSPPVDT